MEYEMDFSGNKIMVVMAVDARGSFITMFTIYHSHMMSVNHWLRF